MTFRVSNANCSCDKCRAAAVAASNTVPPPPRLSDVLREKSAQPETRPRFVELNEHGVPEPPSLSDRLRGTR